MASDGRTFEPKCWDASGFANGSYPCGHGTPGLFPGVGKLGGSGDESFSVESRDGTPGFWGKTPVSLRHSVKLMHWSTERFTVTTNAQNTLQHFQGGTLSAPVAHACGRMLVVSPSWCLSDHRLVTVNKCKKKLPFYNNV